MNERIRQFLITENKSSAQFAEEIGVQPSGISHILSGRNKPSLDFVIKMLDKYRNLSVEWLLFGRGSMYREGQMLTLFDDNTDSGPVNAGGVMVEDGQSGSSIGVDEHDGINQEFEDEAGGSADVHNDRKKVKKIVWFYTDNSFEEYFPSRER